MSFWRSGAAIESSARLDPDSSGLLVELVLSEAKDLFLRRLYRPEPHVVRGSRVTKFHHSPTSKNPTKQSAKMARRNPVERILAKQLSERWSKVPPSFLLDLHSETAKEHPSDIQKTKKCRNQAKQRGFR